MDEILLNDLLRGHFITAEKPVNNVWVKFITINDEGLDPLDDIKENPENLSSWLYWRWNNKLFEEGDVVIALIRYDLDEYVLASIQIVKEDLNKQFGIGYAGVEIEEFKKYYGRTIIRYHRDHTQWKVAYQDKKDQLIVKKVLCDYEKVI